MELSMKNLLVIADKTGGKNTALIRAVSLQQELGCKITLLGFCYVNIEAVDDEKLSKLSRNQLEKKLLSKRKLELTALLEKLGIDAKDVSIEVQWSKHIAQAVNAYCDNHKVDMVIKTTHHTGTVLYTSTDWQLLRECPVPVMITARKSWKKKHRILAAVDFATTTKSKIALNHKIIELAQTLASGLGQEAHFVFAITVPQPLVDMDLIDAGKYGRNKRKKLQPTIDAYCEQYGLSSDQLHIKTGEADKIIPGTASKLKSDLVITGTVGRRGIKGKLMGNTAESVLNRLHTDIIALKP
jgi:universal stress protein E